MKGKLIFVFCLTVLVAIMFSPIINARVTRATIEKDIGENEWVEIARWEITSDGEVIQEALELLDPSGTAGEPSLYAPIVAHDGNWEIVQKEGIYAVQTIRPPEDRWMYEYLYFDLDDDLLYQPPEGTKVKFEFEVYVQAMGVMGMAYSSRDSRMDSNNDRLALGFRREWITWQTVVYNATFDNRQQTLQDAKNENRKIPEGLEQQIDSQRGAADFRISSLDKRLAIRRVSIYLTKEDWTELIGQ